MSFEITINRIKESKISSFDPQNIPFGKIFTDHMFVCDYVNGEWQNLRIEPFGKIEVSPTLSALHYGQSIFEGMKAFKNPSGQVSFFRPLENLKRLNRTAERMCMPTLPQELFEKGLHQLVVMDKNWIPTMLGSSLYIRPFMFATDDFLGVKQSENYTFMIYACPVNVYYSHHLKVKVEEKYTRSAKGGVGSAKCAGNYAAAMYPTKLAQQQGFDQVLWTDGYSHQYLEETGTSNVFVVANNKVYTPELTDTLLQGITRDSVIQLIKDFGMEIKEQQVAVADIIQWHKNGTLQEMFVTGTAATITNIELFNYQGENYNLNMNGELLSQKIKDTFNGIRTHVLDDKHNWMTFLKETVTT